MHDSIKKYERIAKKGKKAEKNKERTNSQCLPNANVKRKRDAEIFELLTKLFWRSSSNTSADEFVSYSER